MRISIKILLIFLSISINTHSERDIYIPDLENPLHDVFYAYYNYDIEKAKETLKDQFDNERYKDIAFVNFGLIMEYEKKYKQAEEYYRMALRNKESISIVYLQNYYKNHAIDNEIPLLDAVENHISSFWIDYEKAVHYLKFNENLKAIQCMNDAVNKGFNSPKLLANDPIFDSLRDYSEFKTIIKKSEKNYEAGTSLIDELISEETAYESDKPFGLSMKLKSIAKLEKKGNMKKAGEELTSLLRSKLIFREQNIALFWMARIQAKQKSQNSAKKYLSKFIDHLLSDENDPSGYKKIVNIIYKDLIANDIYLGKL